MTLWKFAYNESRKGRWDVVVADRCRFMKRCRDVEKAIAYIFDPHHRITVLNYIWTCLEKALICVRCRRHCESKSELERHRKEWWLWCSSSQE